MKKQILISIIGAYLLGSVVHAQENIPVLVDNVDVYVEYENFSNYIDAHNFVYNDRTYVPLRAVSETLGCDVDYEERTGTVTIKNTWKEKFDILSFQRIYQINLEYIRNDIKRYIDTIKLARDLGKDRYNYMDINDFQKRQDEIKTTIKTEFKGIVDNVNLSQNYAQKDGEIYYCFNDVVQKTLEEVDVLKDYYNFVIELIPENITSDDLLQVTTYDIKALEKNNDFLKASNELFDLLYSN